MVRVDIVTIKWQARLRIATIIRAPATGPAAASLRAQSPPTTAPLGSPATPPAPPHSSPAPHPPLQQNWADSKRPQHTEAPEPESHPPSAARDSTPPADSARPPIPARPVPPRDRRPHNPAGSAPSIPPPPPPQSTHAAPSRSQTSPR